MRQQLDGVISSESLTARIANNPLGRHKLPLVTSTSTSSSTINAADKDFRFQALPLTDTVISRDMTEKGSSMPTDNICQKTVTEELKCKSRIPSSLSTSSFSSSVAAAVLSARADMISDVKKMKGNSTDIKSTAGFVVFNPTNAATFPPSSSTSSSPSSSSLVYDTQPNTASQSKSTTIIHRPKLTESYSLATSPISQSSSFSSSFAIFDDSLSFKPKKIEKEDEFHNRAKVEKSKKTDGIEKFSEVREKEKETEREWENERARENEDMSIEVNSSLPNKITVLKERNEGRKVVKEINNESRELDDILSAMGILDSEDGTINTRLAR